MGGTEIGSIISQLLETPQLKGYPRQLFLLTDGQVSNTEAVIKLVSVGRGQCRVHCIGIGQGASKALVKGCSEKGRGRCVFLDDSANVAVGVVELLEAALSPAITDFRL